jgi:hypothetical protein
VKPNRRSKTGERGEFNGKGEDRERDEPTARLTEKDDKLGR